MTDTTEIAALRAQLTRVQQHRNNVVEALGIALEALRWYADEDNYYDPSGAPGRVIGGELERDYGERARLALAEIRRTEL